MDPASGITSNAIGRDVLLGLREVDGGAVVHELQGVALREHALDLPGSSCAPASPEPDTAW